MLDPFTVFAVALGCRVARSEFLGQRSLTCQPRVALSPQLRDGALKFGNHVVLRRGHRPSPRRAPCRGAIGVHLAGVESWPCFPLTGQDRTCRLPAGSDAKPSRARSKIPGSRPLRVESGRSAVIPDRLLYGERDTGYRTYGGQPQSRFRVAAGSPTRLRGRRGGDHEGRARQSGVAGHLSGTGAEVRRREVSSNDGIRDCVTTIGDTQGPDDHLPRTLSDPLEPR